MSSAGDSNQVMPPPPPPPPYQPAPPPVGDPYTLGGLVPYKNKPALVAYYLGIFAFIPVLGILLGIPAFVLGIMGLRKAARNPEVKGKVHAWIGIIIGGVFAFGQLFLFLWVFIRPMIMNEPPGF